MCSQVYIPGEKKVTTVRHCTFNEDHCSIPRISDHSDPGPACVKCSSKDEIYPSKILLCDCTGCPHCTSHTDGAVGVVCNAAWHMSCLPQPLHRVPRGDWYCPNCTVFRQPKRSRAEWEKEGVIPTPLELLADLPDLPQEAHPPLLTDPSPTLEEEEAQSNVSKRGRIRRSPVVYNPTFLALTVFDNVFNTTTSSTTPPEPQTLQEALTSPEAADWMDATVSEVTSLLEKGTFEVVDIPEGQSTVSTKWVFKRKVDAFGNFVKYKARLVAKGFLQKFNVDYFDVFSPVTKLSTLRVLLALVAAYDLELKHVDVRTAFLNGTLDEEVYIKVPEGLQEVYPNKCFKLNKAIYGLKQAPRVWWLNLSSTLCKHGFKSSFADQCLFIKKGKHGTVYCLVYVDDILFAGHAEDVENAVNIIMSTYDATDEGDASSFLGMAIIRDRQAKTLKLSQSAYIDDMATRFKYAVDHPNRRVSVPIVTDDPGPSAPLQQDKASFYASLVGSLLYLANCTRPDISFAVGVLARHFAAPQENHLRLAKQLLKYCIATKSLSLTFGSSSSPSTVFAVGYSDSDYGNNRFSADHQPIARRSVSGYVFFINGTSVIWQSKKQAVMARSTDDAEYIGLATAASTGLWLRKLIGEMTGSFETLTIFGDNQAALKHVESPGSINKSKHIDICYQFVLDRALRNDLNFQYVCSSQNVADIFTKPIAVTLFSKLREKLGYTE